MNNGVVNISCRSCELTGNVVDGVKCLVLEVGAEQRGRLLHVFERLAIPIVHLDDEAAEATRAVRARAVSRAAREVLAQLHAVQRAREHHICVVPVELPGRRSSRRAARVVLPEKTVLAVNRLTPARSVSVIRV